MESRQIIISDSAYSDLEKIENYIAEDSPTIVQRFIEQIFSKIEQFYIYPELGTMLKKSYFTYPYKKDKFENNNS